MTLILVHPFRTITRRRKRQDPDGLTGGGAIATYEPNGSLGVAVNVESRKKAEKAALADCKKNISSKCKLEIAYRNQCAAMVVSDKGYNVTPATTVAEAIQLAMKTCTESGDPGCKVYYSACSMPVQVR